MIGDNYTNLTVGKIYTINDSYQISDSDYPNGFDMGIDEDGFFIHTHRARSKSHEKPDGITVKEMEFIDSTG